MSDGKPTSPNQDTRAAEREDALQHAGPDREPTSDEEEIAENLRLDPKVADSYEKANERGANQEGEGRLP